MKQFLIKYILLAIVLIGCERNRNQQYDEDDIPRILKIDPDNANELKYSQFMEQIEYIPLETSESIILGTVMKVKFSPHKFFVLDQSRLFVFDEDGDFLFNVGTIGRGPGEYTHPFDFVLDTIQQTIEIYCRGNRKLLKYKILNGDFIEELPLNYDFDNLIKTGAGNYLTHGGFHRGENHSTSLELLNSDGSEGELSLKYPTGLSNQAYELISRFRSYNIFTQLNEGILYTRNFDNNIYLINGKSVSVKYKLDFGDANLPLTNSFLEKQNKDFTNIFKNTNKVIFCAEHLSNHSYLYFFAHHKGTRLQVIYNIKQDKLLYGKALTNDIDFGPTFYIAGTKSQSFIGVVSPDKFLDHYSKFEMNRELWNKLLKDNPRIKNLYRTINASDNPILAICHLKPKFVN